MSKYTVKSVANVLAYGAVVLVGLALIIRSVINAGQLANILKHTADAIAYLILAIESFNYAKSRRNSAFLIVWVIAVILISVSYFI